MKSPIFSKEKLLYFPKKSGIVPIFRKSPSSYISYFCEYTPWTLGSKVTVYRRKLQCVFFLTAAASSPSPVSLEFKELVPS